MNAEEPHIETSAQAGDDKTIGIVAYLTLIGLIVAYVMNKDKKEIFGAYHIKQSMGLCLGWIALFIIGLVPIIGWIISFLGYILLLVLWIMGLLNAINGKMEPVPVLGKKFEEWFKDL